MATDDEAQATFPFALYRAVPIISGKGEWSSFDFAPSGRVTFADCKCRIAWRLMTWRQILLACLWLGPFTYDVEFQFKLEAAR